MFRKIMIANRGEIAVRIIRTCREMGIPTVVLYEAHDRNSLAIRLADECLMLTSPQGYQDMDEILRAASKTGADAIHPGYGFLAERPEFAQACLDAGIAFIGPPPAVTATVLSKIDALEAARSAGFPTLAHSESSFGPDDLDLLQAAAGHLGFPVVAKSCSGGRGRGTRLALDAERLLDAVGRAQREAATVYGNSAVYLEQAIVPAHYVAVQILGDHHGNLVHLGEREGSLQFQNQKVIEESPAPCLSRGQRERLWQLALEIGRLFAYRNAGTVEFIVDPDGQIFFTEVKARIQIEHPVTEMLTGVDIVREQIRIAAGEPLGVRQADVRFAGWAMQCRINAVDPWNNYLPSPGELERFRLPGGPHVRVDSYGCAGCHVPFQYDPILAKLIVWGEDRAACLQRMRRALQEFIIRGVQTNLPLHQRLLDEPEFVAGQYDTSLMGRAMDIRPQDEETLRDLAIAAAVAYVLRDSMRRPSVPDRLLSGWHRSSRQI